MLLAGTLCLAGLAGVVFGSMQLRNIGIVGYEAVFPRRIVAGRPGLRPNVSRLGSTRTLVEGRRLRQTRASYSRMHASVDSGHASAAARPSGVSTAIGELLIYAKASGASFG